MTPPRLARWLVRNSAPRRERSFILDDLQEEFERLVAATTPRAAARWYWRQTAGSVRALLRERVRRAYRAARDARLRPSSSAVDVQQAARWIARNPRLAATVVVTLATAFGAVLAAFTVIDGIVLRPLPFPDADRIANVHVTSPARPGVRGASLQDVDDWRRRSGAFEAISAYTLASFRLTGRGEPREIRAERVGRDFERVLGISAIAGRLFEAADFADGGAPVAVLTHGFWQREFGAEPSAIGSVLLLNEQPYQIVGVLPPLTVTFPEPHDIWIPLLPRRGAFWEASRGTAWVSSVGRVREGSGLAAAAAELATIAGQLASEYPDSNRERTVAYVTPIADDLVGHLAPALSLLAIGLAAVLLIACGNIAILLLASISSRRAELAVRAALGAGRPRIARQLAAESLLLSATAAAAGAALTPVLVRLFLLVYPTPLPRELDTTISPPLISAALILAIASAALIAIPQIIRSLRITAQPQWGERVTLSRSERVAGYALVMAQVALSLTLVVAGAALVRTMVRLGNVEPGFRSKGALTFSVSPSPQRFQTAAATIAFYESVLDSIRATPGVTAAAAGVGVPLTSSGWRFGIRPRGAAADVLVDVNLVSPGYFDALGIRVLEGRALTAAEQRTGTGVAMMNAELAGLLADEGESFLGRTFSYSDRSWEIVGIVDAVRQRGPRAEPKPELFIPWHMAGKRPQSIVVYARKGDPGRLLPSIAARIRAIDPTAPLVDIQTLDQRLSAAVAADLFRTTLLAALAAIGVVLAALGAFSTTAYAVVRRTREFSIRLALGERPSSIWRRALWTAVSPAVVGVVAGGAASVASARFLDSFLFEVSARDPRTVILAAFAVLATAVAAASSSARRAAQVDPTAALRVD